MESFKELVGAIITNAEWLTDEILVISFGAGEDWRMYHDQDCCERVYAPDHVDLSPLYNKKLASVSVSEVRSEDKYDNSNTDTTYTFTCEDGTTLNILWYGSSNGYYSETVDFRPVSSARRWWDD